VVARASFHFFRLRVSASLHSSHASRSQSAANFALAGAASLMLTLSANAATVKLGGDDGSLAFNPAEVTIAKGESVTWCAVCLLLRRESWRRALQSQQSLLSCSLTLAA
jgi:hypothetical protein